MHTDFGPNRMSAPAAIRAWRQRTDSLREALHELADGKAAILGHSETAWASVTFAGARHRVELLFEGAEAIDAGELFIALLPEHEFALPGQLVAEATVTEVDHRLQPQRMQVSCELLVLDEA
jgi:hypothetical protein